MKYFSEGNLHQNLQTSLHLKRVLIGNFDKIWMIRSLGRKPFEKFKELMFSRANKNQKKNGYFGDSGIKNETKKRMRGSHQTPPWLIEDEGMGLMARIRGEL